ncbi:uncharacterized protein LACBIDRAFT_321675 [Laccaria bicolor S238N-H82]|uniref:Predicted protein n=1 Tax=Laccaria bicolor (strain S238N-H82 / ATCC MYA-4686) TaxID=486041 RepID=B0CTS1_LACBS|nr:uncharacterized protein LACBIDRAFT_321675 [Laccaria bicolor S238N-H82]EDR14543.1 predicted protein [Laccaria bicolor S238N-H82]|eukprot:XP_001875102.1 predicted protein [Laccaria bicolor S238N-H82]
MATSVNLNVQLWIRLGDAYQHALSIPVHECQRFSLHPLTWLRFLGYAIYGKEGYISRERDGEQVADYRPEDNDFRLLDPKVMDDRTSVGSEVTSRQADFRQDVVNRDRCCVMTGSAGSEGCHIIPHSKGDQAKYMKNLVAHREVVVDPPLESINDTRNGILLLKVLHRPFGASEVAFLQTPNFAMNVDDVPLAMQHPVVLDGLHYAVHPSVANSRLTFHNFSCSDNVIQFLVPHISVAVQSNNDCSPPPFLFDIAYGCAALKAWGVKEFAQFSSEKSKEFYYHNCEDDDIHSARGAGQSKTVRAKKAGCHSQTKTLAKAGENEEVDYWDVVLRLWAHNARKDLHRARMMQKEQTRESIQNPTTLLTSHYGGHHANTGATANRYGLCDHSLT